jgi:hypothetical protein
MEEAVISIVRRHPVAYHCCSASLLLVASLPLLLIFALIFGAGEEFFGLRLANALELFWIYFFAGFLTLYCCLWATHRSLRAPPKRFPRKPDREDAGLVALALAEADDTAATSAEAAETAEAATSAAHHGGGGGGGGGEEDGEESTAAAATASAVPDNLDNHTFLRLHRQIILEAFADLDRSVFPAISVSIEQVPQKSSEPLLSQTDPLLRLPHLPPPLAPSSAATPTACSHGPCSAAPSET